MIWHLSLSERCAARREHFSAVVGTVMVMIRWMDQGTGLWLTVTVGGVAVESRRVILEQEPRRQGRS